MRNCFSGSLRFWDHLSRWFLFWRDLNRHVLLLRHYIYRGHVLCWYHRNWIFTRLWGHRYGHREEKYTPQISRWTGFWGYCNWTVGTRGLFAVLRRGKRRYLSVFTGTSRPRGCRTFYALVQEIQKRICFAFLRRFAFQSSELDTGTRIRYNTNKNQYPDTKMVI